MLRLLAIAFFTVVAMSATPSGAQTQRLDAACLPDVAGLLVGVSPAYKLQNAEVEAQFNGRTRCTALFVFRDEVLAIQRRYNDAAEFTHDEEQLACIGTETSLLRNAEALWVTYSIAGTGSISDIEWTATYEVGDVVKSGQLPLRDDTLLEMAGYDDEQLLSALVRNCHAPSIPAEELNAGIDIEAIEAQIPGCLSAPPGESGEVQVEFTVDPSRGAKNVRVVGGSAGDAMTSAAIRAVQRCGPYTIPDGRRVRITVRSE